MWLLVLLLLLLLGAVVAVFVVTGTYQEEELKHARYQKVVAAAEHVQAEREAAQRDPELLRRLSEATQTFVDQADAWEALVRVGDMYARGDFPMFAANPYVAQTCYKVAAMCPDRQMAAVAQAKFAETYLEPLPREDNAGHTIPPHFAETVVRVGTRRIMDAPPSAFAKRPSLAAIAPPPPPFANVDTAIAPPPPPPPPPPPGHDAQNVHDHGVVTALKNTLGTLSHRRPAMEEVMHAIVSADGVCPVDKAKAVQVLDSLNLASPHSRLGVSEGEALDIVWATICEEPDAETRANLTETLVKQLASGVERGSTVCSTGKIARIVGALDGTSGVAALKPMWAVRDELAALASTVRSDVLAQATPEQQEAYLTGCGDLETIMRSRFESKALALYCTELGMSADIMSPLVQGCMEGF